MKGRAIDKDVDPKIYSKQDPTVFPEEMRADLARWHGTLRKEKTKELIQNIDYIKEERVNALYEAYEQAQASREVDGGRDISGIKDDNVIKQFNFVKGLWRQVVKVVEKKLKELK